MDRTVDCEICEKSIAWKDFQRHLIEEHHLMFVQYIGLIAKSFNMLKWLEEK